MTEAEPEPRFEPEPEPEPEAEAEAVRAVRISSLEEVRDGGFGMGSAAPIDDGAQPLGHAVKGSRDAMQYHEPGSRWYDEATADVWFINAQTAERFGFTRAGE